MQEEIKEIRGGRHRKGDSTTKSLSIDAMKEH